MTSEETANICYGNQILGSKYHRAYHTLATKEAIFMFF